MEITVKLELSGRDSSARHVHTLTYVLVLVLVFPIGTTNDAQEKFETNEKFCIENVRYEERKWILCKSNPK